MRTLDLTPLYRSAVGFDRLAGLLETAARTGETSGWPPYNIETTGENQYRIEIAVAGFKPEELNLEVKENLLTVSGKKAASDDAQRNFLIEGGCGTLQGYLLGKPVQIWEFERMYSSAGIGHA